MARLIFSSVLVAAGLCLASAKVDEAAALQIGDLNTDNSTSKSCAKKDDLNMTSFALTISGEQALLGNLPARFDNQTKIITSSATSSVTQGDVMITATSDENNQTSLHYNMTTADGYCVYNLEVNAGSLFGAQGENTPSESGVVKLGGLSQQSSTRSAGECQQVQLNGTEAAFVLATDEDGDEQSFTFATMSGTFDNNTRVGEIEQDDEKNTTGGLKYLTQSNGTLYLSTELDQNKTGPAGCVFELSVVDGTVLGMGGNSTTATGTTPSTTTPTGASTGQSQDGSMGAGSGTGRFRLRH